MSERDRKTEAKDRKEPEDEYGPGEGPAFVVPVEPEPDEQDTNDAQPKAVIDPARHGKRTLIHVSGADVVRHGEYVFRSDEPVTVPSKVAEELLKLPFEKFIDAPEGDDKAKE